MCVMQSVVYINTIGKQVTQLSQRETARRLKPVKILSAAAQLYEKNHID